MNRCVIVSAAKIDNYKRIKSYLKTDDFFIFCDAGLNHLRKLGVKPNLVVGDFDSHKKPNFDCEIIQLPCEKDDTDTFFAVKEACKRGFEEFLLVGMLGQRFDHSLCNISVLQYLYEQGKSAVMLDDYSEMQIVGKNPVEIEDKYPFFSLMCVNGDAGGITIENAKYPLVDGTLRCNFQMGVSNEVLPGKTAKVTVKNGDLLLIKVTK